MEASGLFTAELRQGSAQLVTYVYAPALRA